MSTKENTALRTEVEKDPEVTECKTIYDAIKAKIKKQHGYIIDDKMLDKAYAKAKELHGTTRRLSGVLYLRHPLAVMEELSNLRCKTSVLCAALLHDTMEDCGYSYEQLRQDFSPEIADIVDAVTAIKKEEKDADERFRQLSAAEQKAFLDKLTDAKLIQSKYQREAFLVRFADRKHNLSTIDACAPGKRMQKIESTRNFLIPAAHRLGMRYFETILTNYCMKYEGDDFTSNESSRILETRNQITAVSGHTYSEFDRLLLEAVDSQEELSLPIFNPFTQARGVRREGVGEVLTKHRRVLHACELKEQLAKGKTFDRSCMDFNEIVLTSKHSNKKLMFSDFVCFHQRFLRDYGVFFEYLGEIDSAISVRLTDKYENNYRLLIIPEEKLDEFFIGSSEIARLTLPSMESTSDAIRPQITAYSYTPKVGYRMFAKCVPQGATALDFAFLINKEMALAAKTARIHTWSGNGSAPFTEEDYHYPLHTIINDGDVVYFDADYSKENQVINSIHHASIEWFAYINTDNAKNILIQYFRERGTK